MEIPYNIQARPDTGLYNAKVGIWLFLASEVMLFGGLFSSYVLLRVGADTGYWPHGWLNVTLGTVNTIILALSAITTLLAWAACKVGQFGKFKFFHACTLALALSFLCVKAYEYHDKWIHYEIKLKDGTFADGHMRENDPAKDYVKIEGRIVNDETLLYDLRKQGKIETQELEIPREKIVSMENYGPWHNTYLALYFTLTGLHALHILGGSVVIGYLWGPGRRMWFTNREQFTNRIEVSGLFWHFVDLVWIFLFPVLYLT
ncbi:MAG TPA: cytochrome c oxidase subunit 3 [Desulfuromonadaceae bacterium]|nr:cytochrome c oxidase subunit 3 [Desulfuromonadaceae bacterium]